MNYYDAERPMESVLVVHPDEEEEREEGTRRDMMTMMMDHRNCSSYVYRRGSSSYSDDDDDDDDGGGDGVVIGLNVDDSVGRQNPGPESPADEDRINFYSPALGPQQQQEEHRLLPSMIIPPSFLGARPVSPFLGKEHHRNHQHSSIAPPLLHRPIPLKVHRPVPMSLLPPAHRHPQQHQQQQQFEEAAPANAADGIQSRSLASMMIPMRAVENFYHQAHAEGIPAADLHDAARASNEWHRKWTLQQETGHTMPHQQQEQDHDEQQESLTAVSQFHLFDRYAGAKNPSPDDKETYSHSVIHQQQIIEHNLEHSNSRFVVDDGDDDEENAEYQNHKRIRRVEQEDFQHFDRSTILDDDDPYGEFCETRPSADVRRVSSLTPTTSPQHQQQSSPSPQRPRALRPQNLLSSQVVVVRPVALRITRPANMALHHRQEQEQHQNNDLFNEHEHPNDVDPSSFLPGTIPDSILRIFRSSSPATTMSPLTIPSYLSVGSSSKGSRSKNKGDGKNNDKDGQDFDDHPNSTTLLNDLNTHDNGSYHQSHFHKNQVHVIPNDVSVPSSSSRSHSSRSKSGSSQSAQQSRRDPQTAKADGSLIQQKQSQRQDRLDLEWGHPGRPLDAVVVSARDAILHAVAIASGVNAPELSALEPFQAALAVLKDYYATTVQVNAAADESTLTEGVWLTLTKPTFFGQLGDNDDGDPMYTLGRMTFDMFSPGALVCSLQGNFNTVERVNDQQRQNMLHLVPKSLRQQVQDNTSVLRTYNVVTTFTIEPHLVAWPKAPNKDVNTPIKGIMTTYGYTLEDPDTPNRHSVWITGGKIQPNNSPQDEANWKEQFSKHPPKHSFAEKAKLLAVKLLMGATVPQHVQDDGSMEYTFTRPLGGHGMAYVDTLYVDQSLRIAQGHRGTIFVFSKMSSSSLLSSTTSTD